MKKNHFPTHYLQKADISCEGYRHYLTKKQQGKTFVFNPTFLITQVLFFVYHKMYTEALLYTLLFATYFNMVIYPAPYMVMLSLGLMMTTMIFTSFFAYRLYEMRNERLLHKLNYQPYEFLKKITPSTSIIKNFLKLFVFYLLIAWISVFFVFFNISMIYPKMFEMNNFMKK